MQWKKPRLIALSLAVCGLPLLASATDATDILGRDGTTAGEERVVVIPKPFRGMLIRINNNRNLTFIVHGYPLESQYALRKVRLSSKTHLLGSDGEPLGVHELQPTDQFVGMINAWDGSALTLKKL